MASIEALGTWVGGLATAAGLWFTATQLRQNRVAGLSRRRSQLRDLRIHARQVRLAAAPFTKHGGSLTKFKVTVENKSQHYVTDLNLAVAGKSVTGSKEQLHPGTSWTWTVEARDYLDFAIAAPESTPGKAVDDPELIRSVREKVLPILAMTYVLGDATFKRDFQTVTLLHDGPDAE